MAKRKAKKTETKKKISKKRATPEQPHSAEPSAISVNPMYDEMPDEIDDPANVFKLAMLEMKIAAIQNKLAFATQDQRQKVLAAQEEQARVLRQIKMELQNAKDLFIAQKNYLEEKYGIALRAYTYNDETGLLTKTMLEDENQQEKKEE